MKRKVFFALNLIVLFSFQLTTGCAQVYEDGYLVRVGDTAPDFLIREVGGEEYKLSDLRGNVVMLQFTASWCSVCRKEMPYIEKDLWQEKKDEGLKVIGIDRDEPPETVRKFKSDMGISYPLALDPGAEIFGLYAQKSAGVTRNVIIDREGKIIFLTRLFRMDEFNEMKEIIFRELEER
ncbi:MAG: redoxin domain-containing protein [Bacteroidales bacterium]|nr:redoxin domain-containing protein [Bacteroidales bacterium]